MKLRRGRKSARLSGPHEEIRDGILVRPCRGIEEFEACLGVERAVWKSADVDLIPVPLFVVAADTGGHVLGAFHDTRIVGFTLAIAGWRDRKPLLHSHMTAVLDGYRDRGIGRRLKMFQREDALGRGISLIEWTFDPLVPKNAYFNFMRLGAVARRYLPNAYGITTSPLHSALPTDRLVAEWDLRSVRVRRVLAGKRATPSFSKRAVRISIAARLPDGQARIEDLKKDNLRQVVRMQTEVRAEFIHWLGKGYAATAVARSKTGVDYILEPWKEL